MSRGAQRLLLGNRVQRLPGDPWLDDGAWLVGGPWLREVGGGMGLSAHVVNVVLHKKKISLLTELPQRHFVEDLCQYEIMYCAFGYGSQQ